MDDCKTVTSDNNLVNIDPLLKKQSEDVATMRASLLSCNGQSDVTSTRTALQNITAMRVYHQISRIIRYTDLMDKIEEKLYESIENSLDAMDSANPSTWLTLLQIQEKLQKSMIESHKLLQPYMDLETLNTVVQPPVIVPEASFSTLVLDQDSRDKVRSSAQAALNAIQQANGGAVNE